MRYKLKTGCLIM